MTILELILRATETELRCALRSRSVRCEFRAALGGGAGGGERGSGKELEGEGTVRGSF